MSRKVLQWIADFLVVKIDKCIDAGALDYARSLILIGWHLDRFAKAFNIYLK